MENIYNWVISVVGSPPAAIVNSNGYSSTTWSPSELLAYATACVLCILSFKLLCRFITGILSLLGV